MSAPARSAREQFDRDHTLVERLEHYHDLTRIVYSVVPGEFGAPFNHHALYMRSQRALEGARLAHYDRLREDLDRMEKALGMLVELRDRSRGARHGP